MVEEILWVINQRPHNSIEKQKWKTEQLFVSSISQPYRERWDCALKSMKTLQILTMTFAEKSKIGQ